LKKMPEVYDPKEEKISLGERKERVKKPSLSAPKSDRGTMGSTDRKGTITV